MVHWKFTSNCILLIADDSQIVKLTIEKHKPVKGGKTIVRIERA